METEQERRVGIGSYSNDSVTITGLSKAEVDVVRGAIQNGNFWIKGDPAGGPLIKRETYKPLPDPVEDEEMHPFWRVPTKRELSTKFLFNVDPDLPNRLSPAFYISSLCGYNYTKERYEHASEVLISFGFNQLRSKRGKDGCFWEAWYLPGLWSAKGDLVDFIKANEIPRGGVSKEGLRKIAFFIFECAPYGSFDATCQRMCMGNPD